MINFKGIPLDITTRKIFRVTRSFKLKNLFQSDIVRIYDSSMPKHPCLPALTNSPIMFNGRGVYNLPQQELNKLQENDIVAISPSGEVFLLWEHLSDNNLLFLTDYCNSNCIMCPQASSNEPQNYYDEALRILTLIQGSPTSICLSGGEPTFLPDKYLSIVSTIKNKFPDVYLQTLTNGKNFVDFNFTKDCVINSPRKTTYAIPLYSANSQVHNHMVGAKNSFQNTIKGIYNLYRFKQNIEIRIVITKHNFKTLPDIAHFIYWNLPFVHHVAFMGMEIHGNADKNFQQIWIEPTEYMSFLENAICFLDQRLINVSIYNLPHCLLPPNLHKYARDSISSWKKSYLPECTGCQFFNTCAGFFTTSTNIPNGIKNKQHTL